MESRDGDDWLTLPHGYSVLKALVLDLKFEVSKRQEVHCFNTDS